MRFQHLAGVMLWGWYLLVPTNPARPISDWRIVDTYESANICNAEILKDLSEDSWSYDAVATVIPKLSRAEARRAKCVAANDAVLAKWPR